VSTVRATGVPAAAIRIRVTASRFRAMKSGGGSRRTCGATAARRHRTIRRNLKASARYRPIDPRQSTVRETCSAPRATTARSRRGIVRRPRDSNETAGSPATVRPASSAGLVTTGGLTVRERPRLADRPAKDADRGRPDAESLEAVAGIAVAVEETDDRPRCALQPEA
jgi:hypothetical protein